MPQPALSGVWHLLAESQEETPLPGHRMDLRFDDRSGRLHAVILSRDNGEEMPLIHAAAFDGGVLRLQMVAPAGQTQEAMPWLIMSERAGRLVGHWEQAGASVGPAMKLVRARD
jgi:hypothetical protein